MDIPQALRWQVFGNWDLQFHLASKYDLKAQISKNLLFWQAFTVSLKTARRHTMVSFYMQYLHLFHHASLRGGRGGGALIPYYIHICLKYRSETCILCL